MENTQSQQCHHCGSELTGETADGLCPRCLLEMNFASQTMPGGEPSPQEAPLSPEEMADKFPQFEILEFLGRGGMGIVYKARQKTLDRLVAIKVLAGERRDDPQFEARFAREARTLAKLSHPNIVTVHDFGESDGMFYLVMEYVDGVNLRDVLHDGRMSASQALAIVPEICGALQFAHGHNVVHRDIKPENILMDRDGRVKIADFGIAALVGAEAEHTGTPPYMAPEQVIADGTIDHRADIYALGVVFYEMLTGKRPEGDPTRPSRQVEIDVRLDEVVLRALEKEPEQRYQTAAEFRTMVETVATPAEGAVPSSESEMKVRFSRTAILERVKLVIAGYDRLGLVLLALGGLIALGAVANFNFMFGFERFSMLLAGVVLSAVGVLVAVVGKETIPVRSGESLPGVSISNPNSPDQRNRWELSTIFAGTLIFILLSAFTWEWSGPLRVPLIVLCAIGLIICAVSLVGVWPFPSPIFPKPNFSSRNIGRRWLRISTFGAVGLVPILTALLFWLQRPQMIDDRTIGGTSPDEMFSAMGQTWHAMRIFDSDRTFYQFSVQGRAGAVWEKWEVPIPTDKLATSYTALSTDEILFGEHGMIVWSEDGKRASFQVNGIEVSAYNTEDGGHSFEGGYLPQCELELSPELTTSFLDLDTGQVVTPSKESIQSLPAIAETTQMTQEVREWMRSIGADFRCYADIPGLRLLDGASIQVTEKVDGRTFDTISAERVVKAVEAIERVLAENSVPEPHFFGLSSNRVYAVKTREGAVALVEILEGLERGSTRLRYKLVDPTKLNAASAIDKRE